MSNTTKYKDNGFYVIYDCFNKADKDCKTRGTWLAAFGLYIKKLGPQLQMRKFITVNINGKALANPNLLALAYVVSLLEGKNPAEFEFEENDIMIDHFNKCMKGRNFRVSRFAFLRRETLKIKREKTSPFLRRERENRFRVFEL
jgi:hypothetical protein